MLNTQYASLPRSSSRSSSARWPAPSAAGPFDGRHFDLSSLLALTVINVPTKVNFGNPEIHLNITETIVCLKRGLNKRTVTLSMRTTTLLPGPGRPHRAQLALQALRDAALLLQAPLHGVALRRDGGQLRAELGGLVLYHSNYDRLYIYIYNINITYDYIIL